MKKILFIDRDGTIIREPEDEQIDSFEKLQFVPRAISNLVFLRQHTDYEFVMVSNQDGLGTDAFPEDTFWPVHNFILDTLRGEGVEFDDILIDPHFPEDNAPTRKPNTGLVEKYMNNPEYDIQGSYVIGDRDTDRQFAQNIGCGFLQVGDWDKVAAIAFGGERTAEVRRTTKETDILVKVDLDGNGRCDIQTGLGFFDHMLEQLVHHGGISLELVCKGDLDVDEHHTMEDCALALGQALREALGDKAGIGRYGFVLPMDECRAMVLLDFGGRPELVWDVAFTREFIGDTPTEMFKHFFKSLSTELRCNLHVAAKGENNHHLAESVFKAFARALKQAVRRQPFEYSIPSSKGML